MNGKLHLQPNTLDLRDTEHLYGTTRGYFKGFSLSACFEPMATAQLPELKSAQEIASQQAYGRLRGKLYKGNAALGVTFAEMRASRELISQNANIISAAAEDLGSLRRYGKMTRRIANRHLEVIFGWQPLLSDIYASCMTVIQSADKLDFVRGSSIAPFERVTRTVLPGWRSDMDSYRGTVRVTHAAAVRIKNPNAWLLERAGLTNPAAILWDKLPYSFIVNMFVNTGALVNSITDFAGLGFESSSATSTYDIVRKNTFDEVYPQIGGYEVIGRGRLKLRQLTGAPPPPRSLTFRIPDVNWELAAMAASLMVQKAVPVIRYVETHRAPKYWTRHSKGT